MEETIQRTNEYKSDMDSFFSTAWNSKEYARRYFYNAPVFNRICFNEEPPIPVAYYPSNYPVKELKHTWLSIPEDRIKAITDYYLEID